MIQVPETTFNKSDSDSHIIVRTATEFIATLFAMFIIYTFSSLATAMYGINLLMIAIGTGIAYAAAISFAAKISGGHINPAVTIAAMLTGRTSYISGILYIIAQIVGAIVAAGLFVFILPQTKMVKDVNWFAPVLNGYENGSISAIQLKSVNASFGIVTALVVEVIAVALIISVAMSSTDEKGCTKKNYAVNMGIAYTAATFVTYQITGSSLNPARSTGIALIAMSRELEVNPLEQLWAFWIAPVFAAAFVGFVILITKLLTVQTKHSAKYGKNHGKKVTFSNESIDKSIIATAENVTFETADNKTADNKTTDNKTAASDSEETSEATN